MSVYHDFEYARHGARPPRLYATFAKRVVDLVAAPLLLALSLPVLALAAAALLACGQRPVFAHRRVGRHGRIFVCYKLQTMHADASSRLQALLRACPAAAAEWERTRKLARDPRVTPLGRFLRRSSIDELPQLWNVIRGEMSLVGPRPITREELRDYGDRSAAYTGLRPGITGLWQVSGRNRLSLAQRAAFDSDYAAGLSLGLDLSILLRTVRVVMSCSGT